MIATAVESPELAARRLAAAVGEAVRASGRTSLRCRVAVGGLLVTVTVRAPALAADEDLPAAIRTARPSVRAVYRIVCDLVAGVGGVAAQQIHADYERRAGEFVGYSTVGHAITELRRLGLIERGSRGWRLAHC